MAAGEAPDRWCEACPHRGGWCGGINQRARCPGISGTRGAVTPARPPTPTGSPTLAGDLVEAAAKRLGADRLAKWIEEKTGLPCNCDSRQAALNRLDATLRKWLGM
jgi:hypothetical protein